jgi:hypothetical protein
MAQGGLLSRIRRWRRKRLVQAPSPWPARISALGLILLVLGAAFIAIYVIRQP